MDQKILKGEIPFVSILLPLIAGIAFAILFPPLANINSAVVNIEVVVLLIFIFCIFFYKRLNLYKHRWLSGLLFNCLIALSGFCLTVNKSDKLHENHFSKQQHKFLVCAITSEPRLSGDILRFETKVRQSLNEVKTMPSTGNLLIALKIDSLNGLQLRYGDLILISSQTKEIDPPFNPNEFDFKSYLAYHSIYRQTFINAGQIKVITRNQGNTLIQKSLGIRQKLVDRFNRFIPDKNSSAVASTLILGYRADLSSEILSAYSKTGTMHVLSVSGMHVGIVFLVAAFLLKSLDRNRKLKFFKVLILLLFVWAYTMLTGFSAAACRAAVMISFVIIGKGANRNLNTYNLLAISAVLLLIYNPFFIVDVGFQLSYLAVAGLVFLYPKIYNILSFNNSLADKIWAASSLSMAAQLATSPLSLYYFHQFPIYFLVSNLFIVVPSTLIMYAGLAFIAFPIDIVSKPLGIFLDESIRVTNLVLSKIEHLPFASLSGIWINTNQYLLLYVLIIVVVFAFSFREKRLVWATAVVLFLLALQNAFISIRQKDNYEIVFYSLRKSNAIGFFDGKNASLVTSLTADDKTYKFSINPSIDFRGIEKFNLISSDSSITGNHFAIASNFMQFRKKRILIWDRKFNYKTFTHPLNVNAVVISDNPNIKVADIIASTHAEILLVDASNKDYNIIRWKKEANELGLKCYVLKRNPAYIINLSGLKNSDRDKQIF